MNKMTTAQIEKKCLDLLKTGDRKDRETGLAIDFALKGYKEARAMGEKDTQANFKKHLADMGIEVID